MKNRWPAFFAALLLAAPCLSCSNTASSSADPSTGSVDSAPVAGSPATTPTPQANVITGTVRMADGGPPRGDIKEIAIAISGISEAGERVQYSPAVAANGTYKQKVADGQYRFSSSRISVIFAGTTQFDLPLEPVGGLWNKDRDAADGIVQDWVWKVTGPTPYGQSEGLDPGNATHWYGMCIALRPSGWRNDINAAPAQIPVGSKLVFKLTPTTDGIDGRKVEPITVEREYSDDTLYDPTINDIVPASYRMSGTASLPDGTNKPLLLQAPGDYPKYKSEVDVKLEKDNIIGGMFKPPVEFIIE